MRAPEPRPAARPLRTRSRNSAAYGPRFRSGVTASRSSGRQMRRLAHSIFVSTDSMQNRPGRELSRSALVSVDTGRRLREGGVVARSYEASHWAWVARFSVLLRTEFDNEPRVSSARPLRERTWEWAVASPFGAESSSAPRRGLSPLVRSRRPTAQRVRLGRVRGASWR
jgi:hypothetical protein